MTTVTPILSENSCDRPKPVLTKADFVRRYKAGEFGNHSPTWNTVKELAASNYQGLVHLRNRVAGGATYYDLQPNAAMTRWRKMTNPQQFYCSAMAPTSKTLIQGEVQLHPGGMYLFYTTVAKPMRAALATCADGAYGIIAGCILRRLMCVNSWEWLQYLLDAYPDHVIEFSTYATNWGTLPNYNTVFWEVRRY